MFIVFRASAPAFNPRSFVAAHKLDGCSFWFREEPSCSGKPTHQSSGFRLPLADAETGAEAMSLICEFVEYGKHWLEALKEQGVHCEIDVGMLVGSESAFTASVTLDPRLLGELSDRKIALVCTAYPSSG